MSTIEAVEVEARRKSVPTEREIARAVEIAKGLFFLNEASSDPMHSGTICRLRFDSVVQALATAAAEARYVAAAEAMGV
jgi:predicted RecA/RadA family phage recombinase